MASKRAPHLSLALNLLRIVRLFVCAGKKKKAASQDGAGKKGTGVAANNETKKAETPGKVRGFVVESMAAEETEKGKEKGTKAEQQQQRQGKKRKRQDTTAAVEDAGAGAENEEEAEAEAEDGDGGSGAAEPKKKKRKRNKKKSKAGTSEDGAGAGPATGPGEETVAESGGGKGSESAAAAVDMSAWDPFDLHPLVCVFPASSLCVCILRYALESLRGAHMWPMWYMGESLGVSFLSVCRIALWRTT